MTNNKNNIPIYEEQQFLPEEQLNIEEVLNQFHQLVPVNFVKLETRGRNYMCSTQGWKEPICERYIFFDNNKPIQLDISQEIITELGLTKKEDINHPVYVLPEVLKRTPIQLGITIKNKKEIFIQKPLTVNNLESELNKWLEENQLLKTELKGEKQMGQSQKNVYHQKIQGIQRNLQTQLNQTQDERNDYQNKWHNSLEDLEQKKEIIRSYQQGLNQKNNEITELNRKIGELEAERDARIGDITLDQWNNDYKNRPTQQWLTQIQNQLSLTQQQFQRELSWWDKWIKDSKDDRHTRAYYGKPLSLLNYLRRISTINVQGNYEILWYLGNSDEAEHTYIGFHDNFSGSKTFPGRHVGERGFKEEFIRHISEYYKNQ